MNRKIIVTIDEITQFEFDLLSMAVDFAERAFKHGKDIDEISITLEKCDEK